MFHKKRNTSRFLDIHYSALWMGRMQRNLSVDFGFGESGRFTCWKAVVSKYAVEVLAQSYSLCRNNPVCSHA